MFSFFTLKIFMALTANSFGNNTGSNCWKFTTTKSLKCYGQRRSSSFGRRWNDSAIKSSCGFTTICIITAAIAFDKCSAWNNRFPWWTIYFSIIDFAFLTDLLFLYFHKWKYVKSKWLFLYIQNKPVAPVFPPDSSKSPSAVVDQQIWQ